MVDALTDINGLGPPEAHRRSEPRTAAPVSSKPFDLPSQWQSTSSHYDTSSYLLNMIVFLLAIQFAIFTFASQCEQGLDTVMQSHVVRLERILRVFQGSWREKTKQYMTITLRDIPSLVQYWLDHSYFTVGSQVFRQRRGASRGSQFAPVLCSAVALQREWNFAMSFSPFTWDRSLHHRYV